MKRVAGLAFTTALLLLLFSAMVSVTFVSFVKANPVWVLDFPTAPIFTSPTVVVHSPIQDHNYNATNVLLNFTIIKPDTWFNSDKIVGDDENGNPLYAIYGNITSIYYIVDNSERQNISIHDTSDLTLEKHQYCQNLNISINLKLSEGTHDILVGVEADSFYVKTDFYTTENATATIPAGTRIPHPSLSIVKVDGFSDTIHFSVADSATAKFVAVASSAAGVTILIGLLIYFKKRKH